MKTLRNLRKSTEKQETRGKRPVEKKTEEDQPIERSKKQSAIGIADALSEELEQEQKKFEKAETKIKELEIALKASHLNQKKLEEKINESENIISETQTRLSSEMLAKDNFERKLNEANKQLQENGQINTQLNVMLDEVQSIKMKKEHLDKSLIGCQKQLALTENSCLYYEDMNTSIEKYMNELHDEFALMKTKSDFARQESHMKICDLTNNVENLEWKLRKSKQIANEQENRVRETVLSEKKVGAQLYKYKLHQFIKNIRVRICELTTECSIELSRLENLNEQKCIIEVDPLLAYPGHGGIRRRLLKIKRELNKCKKDYLTKAELLSAFKMQQCSISKFFNACCTGNLKYVTDVLSTNDETRGQNSDILEEKFSIKKLGFSFSEFSKCHWLVNSFDETGQTGLHFACENGHFEVANFLLSCEGIDLYAGESKKNSLHVTCEKGYLNIAIVLIEKGVDIEAMGDLKRTALLYACGNGHPNIVKYLISKMCNIHHVDANGWNGLHYAIDAGCKTSVELLLKVGVSPLATNKKNMDAFQMASRYKQLEILQTLRKI